MTQLVLRTVRLGYVPTADGEGAGYLTIQSPDQAPGTATYVDMEDESISEVFGNALADAQHAGAQVLLSPEVIAQLVNWY